MFFLYNDSKLILLWYGPILYFKRCTFGSQKDIENSLSSIAASMLSSVIFYDIPDSCVNYNSIYAALITQHNCYIQITEICNF